jgi:hypothetical protein
MERNLIERNSDLSRFCETSLHHGILRKTGRVRVDLNSENREGSVAIGLEAIRGRLREIENILVLVQIKDENWTNSKHFSYMTTDIDPPIIAHWFPSNENDVDGYGFGDNVGEPREGKKKKMDHFFDVCCGFTPDLHDEGARNDDGEEKKKKKSHSGIVTPNEDNVAQCLPRAAAHRGKEERVSTTKKKKTTTNRPLFSADNSAYFCRFRSDERMENGGGVGNNEKGMRSKRKKEKKSSEDERVTITTTRKNKKMTTNSPLFSADCNMRITDPYFCRVCKGMRVRFKFSCLCHREQEGNFHDDEDKANSGSGNGVGYETTTTQESLSSGTASTECKKKMKKKRRVDFVLTMEQQRSSGTHFPRKRPHSL